ncbi:Exosome complex protein [Lachnellula hyalina]|uniref:Exosome complex protein n=1 Tax=Lachnellula hyalina TaxID=1316788 RepID=A0A8H8R5L1_9HELO|nr:Exosome complex protein [Lachnellula hyalina]TVY28859.1 Exosome complex protein [Lachnellula hyalina]
MDSSKVLSLLDQLDDELPLLDKAKLYTLVTYAIESLLFSYLRLHGIKAREHPVFTELTRVKQYFDKIKMTETPPSTTRTVTIDKAVARRFLEPDLAASKKYALLAAELKAKEKVRAHIKFDELNKQIEERQNAQKRKSDGIEGKNEEGEAAEESSDSDSDSSAERVNQAPVPRKSRSRKKRKVSKGQDSLTADDGSTSTGKPKKKDTKKERKKSKENRTKRDKGE